MRGIRVPRRLRATHSAHVTSGTVPRCATSRRLQKEGEEKKEKKTTKSNHKPQKICVVRAKAIARYMPEEHSKKKKEEAKGKESWPMLFIVTMAEMG